MLSLVVPVYNMKKFLPRCMDALLHQTSPFEIILVDDGSTDGSGSLCDEYAAMYPEQVQVVHKQNGGLSSARNAGMDAASGEYVIFPDPDDWVEPNYVQRMTELQDQYHADLTCIGYFIDYDNSCTPANKNEKLVVMDGKTAQRSLLLPPRMNGFAWNKVYRLDIIRENDLRFLDDVGTTEDLDFAYRYLQHCSSVCFDPESRLYHYYQRDGAATHAHFSERQVESLHTYEKMIQSSSDTVLVNAAKEEICNTAVNLIWSYKNAKHDNDEIWKRIKQAARQYLGEYLKSSCFGKGRKIQAILGCYAPSLYIKLKSLMTKNIKPDAK